VTAKEYMRAALEFEKQQRRILQKLQDIMMQEAMAKIGAAEIVPESAVGAVILEHQRLVQTIFESGIKFLDRPS
jgi:hypothetical protein